METIGLFLIWEFVDFDNVIENIEQRTQGTSFTEKSTMRMII